MSAPTLSPSDANMCPFTYRPQAHQAAAGGISAGFAALCGSYQQLAGTPIGVDVLEAAATPIRSPQVGLQDDMLLQHSYGTAQP